MEPEWEEYLLALESLIPRCKLSLGERKRMSNVQYSVHVRIWKGSKKLWMFRIGMSIDLESTSLSPELLDFAFILNQRVSPEEGLSTA